MDEDAKRLRLELRVVLVAIAPRGVTDRSLDLPSTLLSAHVPREIALVVGALSAFFTWSEMLPSEPGSGGVR